MARHLQRRINYPMGSVSSGTMRPEDLIPTFTSELESLAHQSGIVSGKRRRDHLKLVREIEAAQDLDADVYYDADEAGYNLESLFNALGEYAAPYFYFGSHPGNGADYGFWLSEGWDEEFISGHQLDKSDMPCSLEVNDLAEVPNWFRGEVAVVNDHGNVTLYVKTCRTLKKVWAVV